MRAYDKNPKGPKPKLIEGPGSLCHLEPVDDENCIRQMKLVHLLVYLFVS